MRLKAPKKQLNPYIQEAFRPSATSKQLRRCRKTYGRGRWWHKATKRVTETAPKPTNSLLSRRQKLKKWKSRSKGDESNEEGSSVGGHHNKQYGRRPTRALLISLVTGTSPLSRATLILFISSTDSFIDGLFIVLYLTSLGSSHLEETPSQCQPTHPSSLPDSSPGRSLATE